MAVTNIHPIRKTLSLAIDYILNEEKTNGKILVSTNNCMAETASLEFQLTQDQARKGKVLAHHLIQSFEIGEIKDPKIANEIGMKLAKEMLGDKHEFIVSTHIDKGHVHNHIIFNSVDALEHKHYRSNIQSYYNIREKSDRLCKEYNLNVIKNPRKTKRSKNKKRNLADKNTVLTIREKIKIDINNFLKTVPSVSALYKKLEEIGYKIKEGKHTTFISPYGKKDSEKGMRDYKLDKSGSYIKENLETYISLNKNMLEDIKNDIDNSIEKSVSYVDFVKNIKDSGYAFRHGDTFSIKSEGQEDFIKQAVLGDDYSLSAIKEKIEEKSISYNNNQDKLTNIFDNLYVLNDQIKTIDLEINNEIKKRELMKSYYELKPIIDKGKTTMFYETYKEKNKEAYMEFENVNIKMKEIGIKRLEPLEKIDSKIYSIKEKRANLYQDYSVLKEESESIITENIKEKEIENIKDLEK